MPRDTRFDILFEPSRSPVTARNRFYQVPTVPAWATATPMREAQLRGTKAEGGWAVRLHPGGGNPSDIGPDARQRSSSLGRRRSAGPFRRHERIHAMAAFAAIQLVHQRPSRRQPFQPDDPARSSHASATASIPSRRAQWDKADNQRHAPLVSQCRASRQKGRLRHRLSLCRPRHERVAALPVRRHNDPATNMAALRKRLRLFRDILDDVREAIGDTCALAVRLARRRTDGPSDHLRGRGERHHFGARQLPDLWDVNLSDWSNDSQTARFSEEATRSPISLRQIRHHQAGGRRRPLYVAGQHVRLSSRAFWTSSGPRPSIGRSFLPKKIEEGRIDDIRECIAATLHFRRQYQRADALHAEPHGCEEWRKGWHPETIAVSETPEPALIIGGGPAGLEAARALAQRGVDVVLAEGGGEWGGSRCARMSVTRSCDLGPRARLAHRPTQHPRQCRALPAQSAFRRRHTAIRHPPCGDRDRSELAHRRRWPHPPGAARFSVERHPRLSRRNSLRGRRGGAADGPRHRLRRRLLLHGQRAWPNCSPAVDARSPS